MSFDAALVRAVRGPVMLIAVGVLFAIDQNGGWGFERTWPVLIIIFGLFKLVERSMAPAFVPAPPPYPYTAPMYTPPQPPPPPPAPEVK